MSQYPTNSMSVRLGSPAAKPTQQLLVIVERICEFAFLQGGATL